MAKEHSFDVVSEVDLQEVDNAVNQTNKEIAQRYDFKGSISTVEWDGKGEISILADDDFHLRAVTEILKGRAARRGISMKALRFNKAEQAPSGHVRQRVEIVRGLSAEKAKEIVGAIKAMKLKVQPQVLDQQVRVTSKSIDDLQRVIQALKQQDFGIELQFTNFRAH